MPPDTSSTLCLREKINNYKINKMISASLEVQKDRKLKEEEVLLPDVIDAKKDD